MRKTNLIIIAMLVMATWQIYGQRPAKWNAMELYEKVEKLNVLGSVLYIAAHPDDENTRLISYFANERKVRTAYLSLTRGDGGQNLIGTEIWEELGLIRTNELLQARSVDGGMQFFSRANDFGYSKHPDETLAFWNKDEVMHDMIKVIREFKPDIVINRFDHRRAGRTHGHHTSSAILSVEAYDIAGDPDAYRDRLPNLKPWRPERVFFNTSWWFYGSRENFENADKTNMYSVDAGVYYPAKGLSNNEIAALSRSMHKSQGFGSTGSRGSEIEYVELVKGSKPTSKDDPLEGIDISWNRVKNGNVIQEKVDQLLINYDFNDPTNNIPALVDIYTSVQGLEDSHWREIKLEEIKDIITGSAGLYVEAVSESQTAVPGEKIIVNLEMINRSMTDTRVKNISFSHGADKLDLDILLNENERKIQETELVVSSDFRYSNPYWLNQKGTIGMYSVEDKSIIGRPTSSAPVTVKFQMNIAGLPLEIEKDIVYKTNSPVDGEIYKPLYVVPSASVSFTDPIYILPDTKSKEVNVIVKSYQDNLSGELHLIHPDNWQVTPSSVQVNLEKKGEEKSVTFLLKGPDQADSGQISLELKTKDGILLNQSLTEIDYDHIPTQVLLSPAVAKAERLQISTKGNNIAYLQGAGDAIPKSLRQIGYSVSEINPGDLSLSKLEAYDALVFGIRAFNTNPELFLKKKILLEYMESGGTVVVQYNTSRRIKGDDIAPYPMELSRDRVTDELAKVKFEIPDHDVLNFPNKITDKDFEGWVQERGLYFPNNWSEEFEAPLSCHDKGEPERQGGLLIAKVGEGHFIYTGYSWFRQLPAGVPGAFRIFANLLSIGQKDIVSKAAQESGDNE